jgi:hypothetical protein
MEPSRKNKPIPIPEKIDDFKASSYLNYQGDKLVKRFNAYSYWLLTKAMDSHHLGRGRGGDLIKVLQDMQQPTLIIGIRTDILCPLDEQRFMADHIPDTRFIEIDSAYGHDGFIIETAQISRFLGEWLKINNALCFLCKDSVTLLACRLKKISVAGHPELLQSFNTKTLRVSKQRLASYLRSPSFYFLIAR